MIKDYRKYKLFRKYITSDGVNYSPIDEYQARYLNLDRQEDCGYTIDYIATYRQPNTTTFLLLLNGEHCKFDESLWEGNVAKANLQYDFNKNEINSIKIIYKSPITIEKIPDTSNVIDMSEMFYDCNSLTSINLNNFNTSKVTDMHRMFFNCFKLQSLDLSSFDTSKVTDMHRMFYECKTLTTLDLSNFNTSNVTDMHSIFSNCLKLQSLDLSSFDTSKVTDMSGMFSSCSLLQSLDLSNFNTSNVTDMHSIFSNCRTLTTLDLSSFDTSKVTDISWMFYECFKLQSLDLSGWNLQNIPHMNNDMFSDCSELKTIIMHNCTDETVEKIKSALKNDYIYNVEIIR